MKRKVSKESTTIELKDTGPMKRDILLSTIENERRMKVMQQTICLSGLSGHGKPSPDLTTYGTIKLGWVQGVTIPCLLNIWGVMLFLRISWVVAHAGMATTLIIIGISTLVCVITTLSLSSICTNGELEGGGIYYLVSRSLGAEMGASVGIIFAFANSVAASMNTIGFCESLNELLQSHGVKIIDNSVNDIRIVGSVALIVMCFICAVGMDWETRTQNFLIVTIVLAIFNFIIGACLGPKSNDEIAKGFVGISLENARRNWHSDYRVYDGVEYEFFSIFAIYFPSVTGIQCGANICGDLKNPAKAIPKGTIWAIIISLCSYLSMSMLSGLAALRDASGDASNLDHDALASCKPNCPYGMHNNFAIMQLMSLWAPLIYAGCWAATLSTALTNLLAVPRLVQALGIDRIYPGLIFFSKPFGRHGEPYRGYVLVYCISLLFLLIADLNTIAPLISNFYLASYALINFCTFHASFIDPISWRPTFKTFNKWLSLIGFVLCLSIMMVISWIMALVTVFVFLALYLLVVYSKPEANWGGSTEYQRYRDTVTAILQISRRIESIKSYNPQVLVLAGKPYSRPVLLDIGHLLTKVGSFMIVADIEKEPLAMEERVKRTRLGEDWVLSRKNRAFFVLLTGFGLERGLGALLQSTGLGRLSPNILLLGYKMNWNTCERESTVIYVKVIQMAFEERLAVSVLRSTTMRRGSEQYARLEPPSPATARERASQRAAQSQLTAIMHSDSQISIEDGSDRDTLFVSKRQPDTRSIAGAGASHDDTRRQSQHSQLRSEWLTEYQHLSLSERQPIDAWWLYDDGGMNILLPYIISQRGFKDKRTFRIFALARDSRRADAKIHMRKLLHKFRIEYSALTILEDVSSAPTHASWDLFNAVADGFRTAEPASEVLIATEEFRKQYRKTCRHLRLRELMLQHSSDASLIVMTLPVPRKGQVCTFLYMSWLEVMSRDLPPILFVRGNEKAVLDA